LRCGEIDTGLLTCAYVFIIICGSLVFVLQKTPRPFYHEFAWAYDRIIDDDIARKCDFIADHFERNGVSKESRILDAGCGTGRYSINLAERGYWVIGLDISEDLLDIARRRPLPSEGRLDFEIGNILDILPNGYDGILCRGVLNDFISDTSRDAAIRSLGRALRPHGTFILDVRDWAGTLDRKSKEPIFTKRTSTERGQLEFSSRASLNVPKKLLRVEERHTLIGGSVSKSSNYLFTMRCWTPDELSQALVASGFEPPIFFGDYDWGVPLGLTDRIVAIARKEAGPEPPR
jgi:SAM-dependent methyltransferase